METWQLNEKITHLKAMSPAQISLPNSEPAGAEIEEMARRLIGQLLTQASFICAFAMFVEEVAQSSLVTPVTEVHLQSAFSVMESHITNMCGHLKMLTYTYKDWPTTLPSKESVVVMAETIKELLTDCAEIFGL